MYPFKRKTASDGSTSPELTEEEKQRRKKFVIYPLMFLLFAGCMWLIFAPSKKEEEQDSQGFNTEVPDPQASELIGDKKKAYEKDDGTEGTGTKPCHAKPQFHVRGDDGRTTRSGFRRVGFEDGFVGKRQRLRLSYYCSARGLSCFGFRLPGHQPHARQFL